MFKSAQQEQIGFDKRHQNSFIQVAKAAEFADDVFFYQFQDFCSGSFLEPITHRYFMSFSHILPQQAYFPQLCRHFAHSWPTFRKSQEYCELVWGVKYIVLLKIWLLEAGMQSCRLPNWKSEENWQFAVLCIFRSPESNIKPDWLNATHHNRIQLRCCLCCVAQIG